MMSQEDLRSTLEILFKRNYPRASISEDISSNSLYSSCYTGENSLLYRYVPSSSDDPLSAPNFNSPPHDQSKTFDVACNNNPWITTTQPFYNPSHLQHYSLPFNYLLFQQDSTLPSYDNTYRLSHYGFPYPDDSISTPYIYPPENSDYCSFPQVHSDIPNQRVPNFHQHGPQSILKLESQDNLQVYPENWENSNHINENGYRLHHFSDICASLHACKQPMSFVNSDAISRSLETPKNQPLSMPVCVTKPLVHPPLSSGDSCKVSSCCKNAIKTFVPKFYENVKIERKAEEQPLCFSKEASRLEQIKAQVDEFVSSPNKKPGLRKFRCPVCGRNLARAHTLKIHMRQHSGDKPFQCLSCYKSFAQQSLLRSHQRFHNGERPYLCSHCGKAFSHSSALKTHVRTHTGERPYRCSFSNCGAAFADSSTLSKHFRVHSGERPYECDVCGKRFSQSGNMKKHRRTVHKEQSELPLDQEVSISDDTKMLAEIFNEHANTTKT